MSRGGAGRTGLDRTGRPGKIHVSHVERGREGELRERKRAESERVHEREPPPSLRPLCGLKRGRGDLETRGVPGGEYRMGGNDRPMPMGLHRPTKISAQHHPEVGTAGAAA